MKEIYMLYSKSAGKAKVYYLQEKEISGVYPLFYLFNGAGERCHLLAQVFNLLLHDH